MPKPLAASQPPSERRAAETELAALLEKFTPEHLKLVGAVRRRLRKLLPAAHEVVYEYRAFVVSSFTPRGHGHEGVLSFHASTDGVKVYLSGGTKLPDPERLLQGSGKQVRWMDVESAATLKRPAVVALMDAAIALNKIPFEDSGRGSVVIRPTTAKKRRKS